MQKFYTSVILLINQSNEISEKQFPFLAPEGAKLAPTCTYPFCCFYNVLTFQMLLMVGLIHGQLIVCVLCVSDEHFLNHSEAPHNIVYNHLKLWRLKKGRPYLTIFNLICALCAQRSKVKPIITVLHSIVTF